MIYKMDRWKGETGVKRNERGIYSKGEEQEERESQRTSNNRDIERINMTVEKRKVVEIEMGEKNQ